MPQILLEAWITLLDQYLQQAETAVRSGNANSRQVIRKKFHGFIKSTPHRYEFLDDIARNALQDLNDANLALATENIERAVLDLQKQRAIILVAIEEAQQSSKDIKLEHLIERIDQTSEALENLKVINEILKDDDTTFTDKVKEIQQKLKEIQTDHLSTNTNEITKD
jgi:hypothetical protein